MESYTYVFEPYSLTTLPQNIQKIITQQHVVKNSSRVLDFDENIQLDLWFLFGEQPIETDAQPSQQEHDETIEDREDSEQPITIPLRWGTDSYWHIKANSDILTKDLNVIKLRHTKTQVEQKKRSKNKAEVFTPAWVVNMQNNLIDEQVFGRPDVINIESDDKRTWIPTDKVEFDDNYKWYNYVSERRLEMCCGEGPYLFSPYDAPTGVDIPVRDENGLFQRVGILDRKLRVAVEVCDTLSEWEIVSMAALKSTYGFEWQGDNLLLARLNFINTYFEYEAEFYNKLGKPIPDGRKVGGAKHKIMLKKVAELASWQLWQMDGLKMVVPNTCSKECKACKKKLKSGHDGLLSVVRWGANEDGTPNIKIFDEFLSENSKR